MYGYGYNNTFKTTSGGASYDPDAQAYFDSIGDVPTYMKVAISNRIVAFKANGTWANMKLFLPFSPTKTMFGGLRDAKTNAVDGTQVYTTSNTANPSSLYNFPRALNGLSGLNYWGDGAFQTGLNTSTLTQNDTCIAAIYQDEQILTSGYNHGAFGGSTSALIFQKNTASAKTVTGFGYTNSTSTGKTSYTSAIDGGVFIQNIDADNEMWEDGVSKDTVVGTAGTQPSLDFLLNGYSTSTNNGAGSNDTLGAISIYGEALTDGEIAQENIDWQTFQTESKRTGTYDFSVMMDGDSHSVYWNSSWFRNMCYNLSGLAEIYTSQIGVSGQAMTDMVTNQSTNLFPKVQSSYGKLYIVVEGGTNDISGGATGATTLTNLETYCAALKAEALSKSVTVEIIVPTMFNRMYTGNDTAILEQDLFNVGLIAGDAGSVDHVIQMADPYTNYRSDYGSDAAFISDVRAITALTPYTDGTHLSDIDTGYPHVAGLITDYIKTQEGL